MASGPITLWVIYEETLETVTDFILGAPQNSPTLFIVQLSHPYMTIGETIALARWTFVSKVMSLVFNMLSMLVITFLPRSKRLLISWVQSPCSGFGAQKNKVCHCFHCFPIYLP